LALPFTALVIGTWAPVLEVGTGAVAVKADSLSWDSPEVDAVQLAPPAVVVVVVGLVVVVVAAVVVVVGLVVVVVEPVVVVVVPVGIVVVVDVGAVPLLYT
jgi:hypothetical protein